MRAIFITNLLKTSAIALSSDHLYHLLTLLRDNPLLDQCYFRFDLYFICKKKFHCFPKAFIVILLSFLFKFLKKDFFSCLIKLTQIFRCLLYTLQSESLFEFKNLFLSRLLFIISLFLFMKGACLAPIYHFFKGACVSRK